MRRGVLELCILATIAKHGEAYTSDIIKQLESAQLIVVEGTVYPLLSRLREAGLVDYHWKESNAGPPRKYYQITPPGHEVLHSLLQTWHQLADAVHYSTKNINSNE